MSDNKEAHIILGKLSQSLSYGPNQDSFYKAYLTALGAIGLPCKPPTDVMTSVISENMNNEGLHTVGPVMSFEEVDACIKALDQGSYLPVKGSGAVYKTRDAARAAGIGELRYEDECVYGIDKMIELANSPMALDAAYSYLGVLPTIQQIFCTRSIAGADQLHEHFDNNSEINIHELRVAAISNQLFHVDRAGPRLFKFMFYLTDVESETGPHQFITKSHRYEWVMEQLRNIHSTKPHLFESWKKQYRRTDDLTKQIFPADSYTSIEGERGFGFFEDTGGYHRGKPPIKSDRIMCQVLYTMHRDWVDRGPKPDLKNTAVMPRLLKSLAGRYNEAEVRYINRYVAA